VYIPLNEVPDLKQREDLTKLYEAEERWYQEYGPAFNEGYHEYMEEQGLPMTNVNGKLRVAICADFLERDDVTWVCLDSFYTRTKLKVPDDIFGNQVPMVRGFKYDIPWWVQLPFANGNKNCNTSAKEGVGHLTWEASLSLLLDNLDYAIQVHQVFPVWGPAWQWSWVFQSTDHFNDIGAWLSEIHHVSPRAFAILDWSEIALYMMSPKQTIAHNEPDRLMRQVIQYDADKERLYERRITIEEFAAKYAMRVLDNDPNGYIAEGEKFAASIVREKSKPSQSQPGGGGKR
jgi:hypothetical protein